MPFLFSEEPSGAALLFSSTSPVETGYIGTEEMGLCVLGACSKAPAQAWIVEDLNLLPVLYPLVTFKFVSVVDGSCRRGV